MDIKAKIKQLPDTYGVYIMKSKSGQTLYVGKATSLRKRVSSYFLSGVSPKTWALVANIADIEHIECTSEEQALILEAALIKERKPKYNIALRDDKSYPYVEITNEKFPRVFISRPKKETKSMLLGPYPKAGVLRSTLKLVRRIFPYCSCKGVVRRQCLFCHLKLCPAPFAGKISATDYHENIKGIIRILKGERQELIRNLTERMQRLSAECRFEEAALLRDKISTVSNLYQGRSLTHELLALRDVLDLPSIPLYIEAIDISSLAGKEATGSVVVFRNGTADKDSYRRYRIKEVSGIDDYACMAEVVQRRYRRLKRENKPLPDLIIIDGGRSHAQRAKEELNKLAIGVPLIGIAKRDEEIWFPHREKPLIIARSNSALQLIQRLRDEAHRFARKYHLLLREKKIIEASSFQSSAISYRKAKNKLKADS
ncbi:MAG: excinuclease ABC subunit UvrC [Candidatus Omnitrophica bacterium]|nr:excinuclease ABC subunit UvrC [Candidatus Omnitrophota bacterium]